MIDHTQSIKQQNEILRIAYFEDHRQSFYSFSISRFGFDGWFRCSVKLYELLFELSMMNCRDIVAIVVLFTKDSEVASRIPASRFLSDKQCHLIMELWQSGSYSSL